MMKKILIYALLSMQLNGFSIAQSFNIDGLTYSIVGSSSGTGSVSVSGGCSDCDSIFIPDSVTYQGVTYLVVEIGPEAFREHPLTFIHLPNSLTTINYWAFYRCYNLRTINIPSSVTSIGRCAFYDCTNLRYFDLSNQIVFVGAQAFEGCHFSKLYYNSNSGMSFYSGYPSADTVIVGDAVLFLASRAFANWGVSFLSLGLSLKNIGQDAFVGCAIQKIIYNVDSLEVYPTNGMFGTLVTNLTLGDNVKFIPDGAFLDCNGLSSVNLPQTLTKIGNNTFSGCSISSLTLPNSIVSIGNSAFAGCSLLQTINMPNSMTYLGEFAFSNCTNLTSVILSNSLTEINNGVFDGCTNLSSITHYNEITSIGNTAFRNCSALTSFVMGNEITSIGQEAFYDCSGLTTLTLPSTITSIGGQAFAGCTGLVELTIPEGVSNIGFNAFGGCSNIATVNFNARNCGQDGGVFQNNTSLATLNIGNEVQYIPNNMFRGCTSLVSLNVPDAVSEIGNAAFYGCSNLTSTSFGNGLASIGNDAFSQCTRLTSVSLGDGIANIGNNAFMNCGIIGELVIPQGVISIGSKGFKDCFGITEITCLGRVAPTLGADAFDGVDTSITVNIPCGTTNLYAGRWSYFHNFNEIPFLFNVASTDLAQGTVEMLQEPTCNDPVAIVQATPRDGYRFDHWSDGSTQNPYTCTAMGSLTLTAYFASTTDGIDDIETDGIRVYVVDGRIIVEGAENETVRVFDLMGLCVGDNCSQRLTTGVYLVKVGSLPARKVVVIK